MVKREAVDERKMQNKVKNHISKVWQEGVDDEGGVRRERQWMTRKIEKMVKN